MRLKNLQDLKGNSIDIFLPVRKTVPEDLEMIFEKAIAFPGLINSHDHLDFNLFDQYGHKKYINYTEWGKYVLKNFKNEIKDVLKIPLHLRIQWGIYKNLLCGVTTVVNHGVKLRIKDPLINVYQNAQSLHSIHFDKLWRLRLNNPLNRKKACAIHIGEGTDKLSNSEIDKLFQWKFFNRDIIGIHAVAMKKNQSKRFKAIVWCPASNYFLFNETAAIKDFETKILFGTDSTLTASWNIWEHLRLVKKETNVSDLELLEMLTYTPADVWKIPGYSHHQKFISDLVIAKNYEIENNFSSLTPEDILMVIHKGRILLFDDSLFETINQYDVVEQFSKIRVGSQIKFVKGDLPQLIKRIRQYNPQQKFPVEIIDN